MKQCGKVRVEICLLVELQTTSGHQKHDQEPQPDTASLYEVTTQKGCKPVV